MAYATYTDVEAGYRTLSSDEQEICTAMLEEAAIVIDAYNMDANDDAKKVVSCRMVRRALGAADTATFPLGASQGSMSAGGYTQSWTLGGSGSAGELYIGRTEKKLLGVGNRIGSHSPLEDICNA